MADTISAGGPANRPEFHPVNTVDPINHFSSDQARTRVGEMSNQMDAFKLIRRCEELLMGAPQGNTASSGQIADKG